MLGPSGLFSPSEITLCIAPVVTPCSTGVGVHGFGIALLPLRACPTWELLLSFGLRMKKGAELKLILHGHRL